MANINFYWPYAGFLLLLIVPWWWLNKGKLEGQEYLESHLFNLVKKTVSEGRKGFKNSSFFWLAFFWLLLVLALMRPQLLGKPLESFRSGRSIMLTIDTSESMEAMDLEINGRQLNRLEVAKSVLLDFIAQREKDRLGLVVFGAVAFLHAPLSFDLPMIQHFLLEAQIGFAGAKTAIGDAIALSVKHLLTEKAGDKVMVLLTDGQNNSGNIEPMQAALLAEQHGIKIYIVGLGAKAMIVDGFFGPSKVNPSQDLDEAEPELKKMAELSGGQYFRAKDSQSLKSIYDEINKMEPIKVENAVVIPKKELFYWPLLFLIIVMGLRPLANNIRGKAWI